MSSIAYASSPVKDNWELAEEFKQYLNVDWLNLTVNNNNEVVVTGFFSDSLNVDSKQLFSDGGLDIFIAKFTQNKDLIWLKHAGGANVDFSKFINTDALNNIYIKGMFKGEARFGTNILKSTTYEYFTAKFNDSGELLWVKTRHNMMDMQKKKNKKSDYAYSQQPNNSIK
ncbi:hypothetical protein OAO55_00690 [Bacteroidales bacterium]|nr:hypothetical protein [Bacteroidales bacterium]